MLPGAFGARRSWCHKSSHLEASTCGEHADRVISVFFDGILLAAKLRVTLEQHFVPSLAAAINGGPYMSFYDNDPKHGSTSQQPLL